MTDYLITLTIGPVQSLIAAGRRTRDLWCGSWLLSEVSRAAADALLQQSGVELIFPEQSALAANSEADNNSFANIANVIRAEVTCADEAALKQTIQMAKEAAENALKKIFHDARSQQPLLAKIDPDNRWEKQQEDALEFFAAWVSLQNRSYGQATERLGQLLNARKQTRNFTAMADNADGIHKSHLDGANNSVINKLHERKSPLTDEQKTDLKRTLGISGVEELDALGVVKRLAGDSEQFTSFSRIVADSWLQTLDDDQRGKLAQTCEPLVQKSLITRISGNDGCYKNFPFDGEFLFPSRIDAYLNTDATATEWFQPLKTELQRLSNSPVAYGVLLKADGDRMGELLKQAQNKTDSQKISRALSQFADQVRSIVQQHRGHAVYAGGDDVLAFLPLVGALPCATELAKTFKRIMEKVSHELTLTNEAPTLSVGLAIGHFVQPMRQLRQRADAAEKYAKGNHEEQPRNALAIHLGIRSGHEIHWRCRWDDQESLQRMHDFIDAYQTRQLPSRLAEDLRQMAPRLAWTNTETSLAGIRSAELTRLLTRARLAGDNQASISPVLKAQLIKQADTHSLEGLANQLTIARWLAAKTLKDTGEAEQ